MSCRTAERSKSALWIVSIPLRPGRNRSINACVDLCRDVPSDRRLDCCRCVDPDAVGCDGDDRIDGRCDVDFRGEVLQCQWLASLFDGSGIARGLVPPGPKAVPPTEPQAAGWLGWSFRQRDLTWRPEKGESVSGTGETCDEVGTADFDYRPNRKMLSSARQDLPRRLRFPERR